MRNTHLTMGIASAVAFTNPTTVPECLVAVMGGVIGGLICDIDIWDNGFKPRRFFEKFIAIKITAVLLLFDFIFRLGICEYIFHRNKQFLMIGGILFGILCLIGMKSAHRTFTHSFTGLVLFSIAFWFLYPPIVYSFMFGFLSHIVLDLLNKKKIRLFYPKEFGLCFGICYADGIINTVFMYIGALVAVVFLVKGLFFN